MKRRAHLPSRILLCCGLAGLLVACENSQNPQTPGSRPSFDISDGSSGGNADFFFTPPLAANPSGDPNFDPGASNPALAPFAKICELLIDGMGNRTCGPDVTPGNPGGLALVYDAVAELYKVNWKTSQSNLSSAKFYRIEVFAVPVTGAPTAQVRADFRYGFRDVDPDDGPNVSSCGGELDCKIQNGSNVPIKVRIEQFASCPVT